MFESGEKCCCEMSKSIEIFIRPVCWIWLIHTLWHITFSYLTVKSSSSGRVSRRCRLERARGGVEGGSRKSFSSCSVLTKHGTSPTNAWASLAVMALEKPRPCKERLKFSKHLACGRSKIQIARAALRTLLLSPASVMVEGFKRNLYNTSWKSNLKD